MKRVLCFALAMTAAVVSKGALATETSTSCAGDVTVDDTHATTCKTIGGNLYVRGTRTPNLDSVVEVLGDVDMMLRPVPAAGKTQSVNAPSPAALKMPNLTRAGSILITFASVTTIAFPQLQSVDWIWFQRLALTTVEPFASLVKGGRIQISDTTGADSAFTALTEAIDLQYSGNTSVKPSLPKLTTVSDSLLLSGIGGGAFPSLTTVSQLETVTIPSLSLPRLKKVKTLLVNPGATRNVTAGPAGVESIEVVTDLLEIRNASFISTKDKGLNHLKKVGTLALEDSECSMPADQIRALSLDLLKIDVGSACWKALGPSLRKRAKKTVHYDPDAYMRH